MKERGYLESRGRGVCWSLVCSLARPKQPAVAEHRQVQHGEGNHPWEEEGRVQPKQPGVALRGDSFCAAWRKTSSGELVPFLCPKQALGERSLQERGGMWGAVLSKSMGRHPQILAVGKRPSPVSNFTPNMLTVNSDSATSL